MKQTEFIKDVGIYLRKSRASEETDETLAKHKDILVSLAKKYGFNYTIYEEIISGDKIDNRPEMQRLLNDVQMGLYDAVLVVSIDRLGRGDEEDSGKIKKIFKKADTLIITPEKVYNLENEDDETYLEFQTFLARQEFKLIKKRFIRGKRIGAKQGKWTNGIPPYPYEYDRIEGKLVINPDKLVVYNMIKDMTLTEFLPLHKIATILNKRGIPSPQGKSWSSKVIRDLLLDETHLGKIVYGKTKGANRNGNKVIKIPRDEWIISNGHHEAVKTEEEHQRIVNVLKSRTLHVSRFRNEVPRRTLQGLVICGFCGSVMQVKKSVRGYFVVTCVKKDRYGNNCVCRGIKEDVLIQNILDYIDNLTLNATFNEVQLEIDKLNKQYAYALKRQKETEEKIKKINEAFEEGTYTKAEFIERKKVRISELEEVKQLKESVEKQLDFLMNKDNRLCREDLKHIRENLFSLISSEEKNSLLRQFIERVVYYCKKTEPKRIRLEIYFR